MKNTVRRLAPFASNNPQSRRLRSRWLKASSNAALAASTSTTQNITAP